MGKRTRPSEAQLDQMLKHHVSFEINRFRLGVSLWGKRKLGTTYDAMIRESCLIHMRLLLDFFFPRPGAMTNARFKDIFVFDYVPENVMTPEFRELLKPEPDWVNLYRNQLDWRLAHLTMERFNFERNPYWQPEKQFRYMDDLIKAYIQALPSEKRSLYDSKRGLEGL